MSRREIQNSGFSLAYGNDHIMGLFIQVFDKADIDDEPVVDMDATTHPDLTIERIVAIADDYGFDLSAELSESAIR